MMKAHSKNDEKTRARLIKAAGEVFSRDGFRSGTVREICRRAKVHVGAVNYHFRDKEGLYTAVLEYSCQAAVQKYPPDIGLKENATPEEKLRAFIRSFLLRIFDTDDSAWHGKLMAREIVEPTGLIKSLAQKTIRPFFNYLEDVVQEIFTKEEIAHENRDIVFACTVNIIGQCLYYYIGRQVIEVMSPEGFDLTNINKIVDHITCFSIGGIRSYA